MLSADDIKKLGRLASLSISPSEEAALTKKLGSIIEYVDRLKEVNTTGVQPMSHVHGSSNVFRDDVLGEHMPIEALKLNVPDHSGRFIRVPLIVE